MLSVGGLARELLDSVTQLFENNCPPGHGFSSGLRLNSKRVWVQSLN
jgi:hypothetical protein